MWPWFSSWPSTKMPWDSRRISAKKPIVLDKGVKLVVHGPDASYAGHAHSSSANGKNIAKVTYGNATWWVWLSVSKLSFRINIGNAKVQFILKTVQIITLKLPRHNNKNKIAGIASPLGCYILLEEGNVALFALTNANPWTIWIGHVTLWVPHASYDPKSIVIATKAQTGIYIKHFLYDITLSK